MFVCCHPIPVMFILCTSHKMFSNSDYQSLITSMCWCPRGKCLCIVHQLQDVTTGYPYWVHKTISAPWIHFQKCDARTPKHQHVMQFRKPKQARFFMFVEQKTCALTLSWWYASKPLDVNKSRLNCPLFCSTTHPHCYQLLESQLCSRASWALAATAPPSVPFTLQTQETGSPFGDASLALLVPTMAVIHIQNQCVAFYWEVEVCQIVCDNIANTFDMKKQRYSWKHFILYVLLFTFN